jgi:hypothetical protein
MIREGKSLTRRHSCSFSGRASGTEIYGRYLREQPGSEKSLLPGQTVPV